MPEWTAEARDVQELIQVLTTRYEKATVRAEEIRQKHGESTIIVVPSNVSIEIFPLSSCHPIFNPSLNYVFRKYVGLLTYLQKKTKSPIFI